MADDPAGTTTTHSRTVDLDGPVHYLEHDGDGSPMVLVHGLGGSHLNWVAVGPALARRHRVLVPDLAGFGRTPLDGRSATVQANARLVASFLARVVGGPAVLVGNSMGGLIAMMVAAASPDLVSALVLVDASYPPAWGSRVDPEVALIFSIYMIPGLAERIVAARWKKTPPDKLVREMMRLCCAEPDLLSADLLDPHVALETERRSMPWARDALLQAARSILRTVLWPGRAHKVADAVRAPTLVIHGEKDRLVSVGAARAAARRRLWDLEVLPGIGHVPQLEMPDAFVDIVERWLERVASR